MKYIKLFDSLSALNTFKQTDDFISPNVSLVENEDDVYYNPLIIINPSVTMANWTYGETASNPVISGNTGNGTVTYMYKVSTADDNTYTPTKPSEIGTYTVKATIMAKGQYSTGLCTTTFTISKANINPSVSMANWTYGETASDPIISGNTGNAPVTYMYKVSTADDNTYTSTKPSDAGAYIVKATIDATTNYNGAICMATFTISKVNINPSITMSDWNEGETASDPVVSGNTGNGTVTYMYKVSTADDNTYTSTKPSNAGTYIIKATIDTTTNYNGGVCIATFTINSGINILIAKYNVVTTTYATKLYYNDSYLPLSSMKIDDVEVTPYKNYKFSTTGEHTVKYELTDSTSIGDNAFNGCPELTSITIPSSVTSIGNSAFSGCKGLTSITIPNSVTSIGNGAFENCSSLTSINIPYSVTSIGERAFTGCSGLTSITIPDSVTSIARYAFWGCSGLTSITIPNQVTSIGMSTFQQCSGLTSITIPNSVTSIGEQAFWLCSGLTSVIIGSKVETIDSSAFASCSGLTSITCNATTAPTILSNTFQDIKSGGTLTVPTGSTGYDTWMGTGDYYLGKYNWTKVEQ